eukprot:2876264-Alexandrium_andersonii.AAC.1
MQHRAASSESMMAGRPPDFLRRTWWSVSSARTQSTVSACAILNLRSKSFIGMLPVGWTLAVGWPSAELD